MTGKIKHPTRPACVAHYGFSIRKGFWTEVYESGRQTASCSLQTAPDNRMASVLWLMVAQGFFNADDVPQAYDLLQVVDDRNEIDNPQIRRAAEVIERLKREASQ